MTSFLGWSLKWNIICACGLPHEHTVVRCSDHFSVGLFVEIQFRYRPWINIEQVDCSLIFSILNNSIKLLYGSFILAD